MAKKKKLTLEEKLEEAIVKDAPYEVPENWLWSNFLSLFDVTYGKNLSTKKLIDKGYPVFGANGYIGFYNDYMYDEEKVLISCRGAYSGSVNLVKPYSFITNNSLIILQKDKRITNKFLKYLLMASDRNILISGTAQPQVTVKAFEKFYLPIPPLKEQERIVERIESLFKKLDKSKELIEEARDGFEKRKAAILEKAFRGELTEKWRCNNNVSNESLRKTLLDDNKAIKKNFEFSDSNSLFNIPEGWSWFKLKDLCEKFKYGTSTKSQLEGNVPVLRMGNLQQGKIIWDNLVYTSDLGEIKKYDLKKGDLLFNRTNSPELVGKTSFYDEEMKAIFAGYLIRVRVLNKINSKYINYFMNSIYAKARCMEVKSDGVSQSNINAEKLGDFDIPLPSIEEQKQIVKILDKLFEEENKIEELTQLEEEIELIKKSILAKAFRGEVGTNNSEEESALELLKKILDKE